MWCGCRYLNALQTTAQHLLRYLAAAVVVNKRRRNAMKDLIRVIEQEAYEYSDPITQFLECLFVRYDFEGAQVLLQTVFTAHTVQPLKPTCRENSTSGHSSIIPLPGREAVARRSHQASAGSETGPLGLLHA